MKILFLDIDGVLNVIPQGRDEFGPIFHQHFVENLRSIIFETGASIVISSTWRMDGIEKLQRMWKARSLPGTIIGVTPDCTQAKEFGSLKYYDAVERGHEIAQWISEHPEITSYAIADDDNDMLESQRSCFVRTANVNSHSDHVEGYGLTKICSQELIRILNRKFCKSCNSLGVWHCAHPEECGQLD